MTTIRFGTDGWRGIIAQDFTFDNVRICAQAVADYLEERNLHTKELVIGYDTRFASEKFAEAVAEVMAGNGIKSLVSDFPCPTPVVSWAVMERQAAGAVIITASHNAAHWNGFKYKPEYAGSASPEIIANLERLIESVHTSGRINRLPFGQATSSGLVEVIDPSNSYYRHVETLVDIKTLKEAGLNVVVDSMFGSGTGYIHDLLGGSATTITEIHGERNPTFPGIAQPEPIPQNLRALCAAVIAHKADVGIALDGDADRVGIVNEYGQFMTPLEIFGLLALYLLETRAQRGPLVKSLTMSSMAWDLGRLFKVPIYETPVGFKHIGPVMTATQAILGGEESGGFGFRDHIPERDGILSSLFILDMMVKLDCSPSKLLRYLHEKIEPRHYTRWDIPIDQKKQELTEMRVRKIKPKKLAGYEVISRDEIDGVRFYMEGGAWVIARSSGTEPLLRLYAEAKSSADAEKILKDLSNLLGLQ